MGNEPDFDAMYDADPDPWEVETSWYERRKLAVHLASLPRERYATAWEPASFSSQPGSACKKSLTVCGSSRVSAWRP